MRSNSRSAFEIALVSVKAASFSASSMVEDGSSHGWLKPRLRPSVKLCSFEIYPLVLFLRWLNTPSQENILSYTRAAGMLLPDAKRAAILSGKVCE